MFYGLKWQEGKERSDGRPVKKELIFFFVELFKKSCLLFSVPLLHLPSSSLLPVFLLFSLFLLRSLYLSLSLKRLISYVDHHRLLASQSLIFHFMVFFLYFFFLLPTIKRFCAYNWIDSSFFPLFFFFFQMLNHVNLNCLSIHAIYFHFSFSFPTPS